MPVHYISMAEAMASTGLRMTVVDNTPSPWGEAAKSIFFVKGIAWQAVRYDAADKAQYEWTGANSAPCVLLGDEPPLSNWKDILLLGERLSPAPSLLPKDKDAQEMALSLSEDFCGEDGLGWHRRLQAVHAGLNGQPGFPVKISKYLGSKYGYSAERGHTHSGRVTALLGRFADHLHRQKALGSDYYIEDQLSCADIYSATFTALFSPLPEEQCKMSPQIRQVFETYDAPTRQALDPILLQHRDRIYNTYLELPLTL